MARLPPPPSAGGQRSPLTRSAILALIGAAGLVGLGVFGLFQTARSAGETARLEAGRAASVTARALRAALTKPEVLALFRPEDRFSVEEGRVVVPESVGWIDAPTDLPFPEALPAEVRRTVTAARRIEFREGDGGRALALLRDLAAGETQEPSGHSWVLLAAASCAHRAGETGSRDALLDALISRLDEAPGDRSRDDRDDVVCGVLVLCAKSQRALPVWFPSVFARVGPDMARTALARARTLQAGVVQRDGQQGPALESLERALAEVEARRALLRRARQLLPSLRHSAAEVREVGSDVLLYFGRDGLSGEGALVDTTDLARTIDSERDRSTGALATVGSGGVLVHGPELASHATAIPVVPGLLGIAPAEPAPGSARPHWQLVATVSALAVLLVLGLGVALRSLRKAQLHTRARAEFLTAVTHELKTPLASIRLLADVLADGREGREKRATYLERLAGETARLAMLVENVLDLGRIERGERGYDLRRVDLKEVVRDAVLLYRPLASREGMELAARLDDREKPEATGESASGGTWMARVDRGAITQVLLNLFENARRYARDGGCIEVTGSCSRGLLRLLVRDRGPGIPEAEREAVFEKFRRGGPAPDAANPGVGLGLFLARAIVRDHGGDLRCVAPPDGAGAAFEMTLPLEPRSPEPVTFTETCAPSEGSVAP